MNQWNLGWPLFSWIWLCFLVSGVYRCVPPPFLTAESQITGQTGQPIRCLWVKTSKAYNLIFCHHHLHLHQPLWFSHCLHMFHPYLYIHRLNGQSDSINKDSSHLLVSVQQVNWPSLCQWQRSFYVICICLIHILVWTLHSMYREECIMTSI